MCVEGFVDYSSNVCMAHCPLGVGVCDKDGICTHDY